MHSPWSACLLGRGSKLATTPSASTSACSRGSQRGPHRCRHRSNLMSGGGSATCRLSHSDHLPQPQWRCRDCSAPDAWRQPLHAGLQPSSFAGLPGQRQRLEVVKVLKPGQMLQQLRACLKRWQPGGPHSDSCGVQQDGAGYLGGAVTFPEPTLGLRSDGGAG